MQLLLPPEILLHIAGFCERPVHTVFFAMTCRDTLFLLREPRAFGVRTLTPAVLQKLVELDVCAANRASEGPFRCSRCLATPRSVLRCAGLSDACLPCIRKRISALDQKLRETLDWYATRIPPADVIQRWSDPGYTRAWVSVKLVHGTTPDWARKTIGWVGDRMPDGTLATVYELNNWVQMTHVGSRIPQALGVLERPC